MSISLKATFCPLPSPTPWAQNAHHSSHVKGNFIVFSPHLAGFFPWVCKRALSSDPACCFVHDVTLLKRAILLQIIVLQLLDPVVFLLFLILNNFSVLSSSNFLLINSVCSAEEILWPSCTCLVCSHYMYAVRIYHHGIYTIALFTSVTFLKLSPLGVFEELCFFILLSWLPWTRKIRGTEPYVSQQVSFSTYQQFPPSSQLNA